MKQKPNRVPSAFTLVEVVIMMAVLAMLVFMYLPHMAGSHKSPRIACVNNLKEIGTAYRLWAGDNDDLVPTRQAATNGGWADFLTNANQGALCWTNYAIMSNELGQSTKLLICPCDDRMPALSFTNKINNLNVSYFVGVGADDTQPHSIQGGDRNLGPGTVPSNDFGYSPKTGKGNDVAPPINSSNGPVSWSLKMHSAGNTPGAGNILLGDGSVQQVTTSTFNREWLSNAPPTTNWPAAHIPATPSIRLIFP